MPSSVTVPLLLVLCGIPLALSDTRRLLARDIPVATCANTVQGRWYVTDDRGYTCPREQLDSVSGCCSKGEQFSCKTCSLDDKCCSQYENCVSCCLAPVNKAEETMKAVWRGGHGREETGRWPNAFEYCRGKCRTSLVSTVHENAYLAPDIHCFSALGKPLTVEPVTPPLPDGITAVNAAAGEDCATACASAGGSCQSAALPALNNCNVLREHFPCEAGCGPHPSLGGIPGYRVPTADKQEQPAFCWTHPDGAAAGLHGCDVAGATIQRLCPCSISASGAAKAASTAAGAKSAGAGVE